MGPAESRAIRFRGGGCESRSPSLLTAVPNPPSMPCCIRGMRVSVPERLPAFLRVVHGDDRPAALGSSCGMERLAFREGRHPRGMDLFNSLVVLALRSARKEMDDTVRHDELLSVERGASYSSADAAHIGAPRDNPHGGVRGAHPRDRRTRNLAPFFDGLGRPTSGGRWFAHSRRPGWERDMHVYATMATPTQTANELQRQPGNDEGCQEDRQEPLSGASEGDDFALRYVEGFVAARHSAIVDLQGMTSTLDGQLDRVVHVDRPNQFTVEDGIVRATTDLRSDRPMRQLHRCRQLLISPRLPICRCLGAQ